MGTPWSNFCHVCHTYATRLLIHSSALASSDLLATESVVIMYLAADSLWGGLSAAWFYMIPSLCQASWCMPLLFGSVLSVRHFTVSIISPSYLCVSLYEMMLPLWNFLTCVHLPWSLSSQVILSTTVQLTATVRSPNGAGSHAKRVASRNASAWACSRRVRRCFVPVWVQFLLNTFCPSQVCAWTVFVGDVRSTNEARTFPLLPLQSRSRYHLRPKCRATMVSLNEA